MSQGQTKLAALSFMQANTMNKDLFSLSGKERVRFLQTYVAGLILANLELVRYPEALSHAKDALMMMPRSSRALTLMSKVLVKHNSQSAQDQVSCRREN